MTSWVRGPLDWRIVLVSAAVASLITTAVSLWLGLRRRAVIEPTEEMRAAAMAIVDRLADRQHRTGGQVAQAVDEVIAATLTLAASERSLVVKPRRDALARNGPCSAVDCPRRR